MKQEGRCIVRCYEKTCMWNKDYYCTAGMIEIGSLIRMKTGWENHKCDSYKFKEEK